MKRQELEKKLRKAGCYLKREGASHSLWINPQTGVIDALSRHKHRDLHFGQHSLPTRHAPYRDAEGTA